MSVIIGTAGHVDHGKSELIKALTGVDPDRLEEEKRRGLTIDLGFAPLVLEKAGRVGVVDVPGHIHFLKNMLAGVGSIDVALMVVAGDEGIMPQTSDHFQILKLLQVPAMVVAITKMDLIDEETALVVEEEVKDLLKGSHLEGAPLVHVSSITGHGLDELRNALEEAVAAIPPKDPDALPRLPVDRVFTLKGIGTVVTGSLISGSLVQGEEVCVYPKGKRGRVRQIQVHNEFVERVSAGNRVALNLAGLERGDLERGDVIARLDTMIPSRMVDVKLETLETAGLFKDWTRVRLHLGSAEILARTALLGQKNIPAGQEAYCQMRLESPVAVLFGDRFVVRNYSPLVLIGGGTVLDPAPGKHRRFDPAVLRVLGARDSGEQEAILEAEIALGPVLPSRLARRLNLHPSSLESTIARMVASRTVLRLGPYLVNVELYEALKGKSLQELRSYARKYPMRAGMSKEELRSKLGLAPDLFEHLLAQIEEATVSADKVSLSFASVELSPQQREEIEKVEHLYLEAGINAPGTRDVLNRYDSEVVHYLQETGVLIRLEENLLMHRDVIRRAQDKVQQHIQEKGELRISELRDILGSSRKYVVPLAEYLDRIGYTKREGEVRVLGQERGRE